MTANDFDEFIVLLKHFALACRTLSEPFETLPVEIFDYETVETCPPKYASDLMPLLEPTTSRWWRLQAILHLLFYPPNNLVLHEFLLFFDFEQKLSEEDQ